MKYIGILIIFIAGFRVIHYGQESDIDRTRKLLDQEKMEDTTRIELCLTMGGYYYFTKPDSALVYAKKALDLSKKINHEPGTVMALNMAGEMLRLVGDYPGSLKMQYEALDMNKKMKDVAAEAASLGFIGITYIDFREYRQGLQFLQMTNALYQKLPVINRSIFALSNTGDAYAFLKMPDSALYYQRLAFEKLRYLQPPFPPLKTHILIRLGDICANFANKDSALYFYYNALSNSPNTVEKINTARVEQKIASVYQSMGHFDSALYYGQRAFTDAEQTGQKPDIMESATLLANLHKSANKLDSALIYQEIASEIKDSLYGPHRFKQLQLLMLEEQEQQQQIVRDQERYRNRINYSILISALGVMISFGIVLLRNNRQKQKAKVKIEEAYSELKAAQQQLIQSEKMASLGELTAGIAHEIQNPLNFVNNFSEVNSELIAEMKQEIDKVNLQEVKSIADSIDENEQKIISHGKRADAIVKGMLQHSRSSSGVKEPTDINALCDEYLRLSYHGLRAKDKSFNATMKTDFDETIGEINIVPQDIGRVVLNLINNAFYAVDEKKKKQPDYEAIVTVATRRVKSPLGDLGAEIKVVDNANGIPQKVLDKIFQPFFTTKPTGQGTGLGLSLSYDIIKTHAGEIKVETKEGVGSEFIIQLPNHSS